MYQPCILLEQAGKLIKGRRVHLGELKDKNEAWLRDTLFQNPDSIPVSDVDPAFGRLIPLCKELRTEAGPIDAVFINEHGRLTIIECKLWKNRQARREVVAQTLHYVSALSRWTYGDLQRQVSATLGKRGNVPFELVHSQAGTAIIEPQFVDAASRALREGRILVLIAGEGIREGVQSLTELINRSATKAFSFGLIEVAIYQFEKGRFAIQPRILAQTEIVTRHIAILGRGGETAVAFEETESIEPVKAKPIGAGKGHLKDWWAPVLKMTFDDPEQEPPKWLGTNNVALVTPFPGIQIKAWAMVNGSQMGVYLTGTRVESIDAVMRHIKSEKRYLAESLPTGTRFDLDSDWPIVLKQTGAGSDKERYNWLKATLNTFVNVLRPRLKDWHLQGASE